MKNIIFEIRYYLLFLVLSVGFFLTLIFNSESSTNSVNENFNSREIERSNIDLEKFLPLTSEQEQTSNRTHIIYVEKNNTLIELLDKAGLSNKYIRALIKAKGSEKLANLKIGDKLEIDINRDQVPGNIFLTSDGLNGINANFKNGLFSIFNLPIMPGLVIPFEATIRIFSPDFNSAIYLVLPSAIMI